MSLDDVIYEINFLARRDCLIGAPDAKSRKIHVKVQQVHIFGSHVSMREEMIECKSEMNVLYIQELYAYQCIV